MTSRARRSLWWLAAAVALLLTAAWLFGAGEGVRPTPGRNVSFPRFMDHEANERVARRRSLSVALPPTADAGTITPRPLDPVLAALPPRGTTKVAIVMEANALVNSPIGQAFLECLGPGQVDAIEQLEKATGVDVLQDLDRIATTDGVFIASGHFGAVDPSASMPGGTRASFGAHATIWSPPADVGGPYVARWKDELVLVGQDRAELEAAIDRLDGAGAGAEAGEPAIAEGDSYGEIYGALAPEVFDEIVPPELASRLREVADRVELHVGAEDDVGVVVEVDGSDVERVEELARALGGALALGRVRAKAEGEGELAELLDLARVRRDSGRLAVELALPRKWLEERVLGPCRERARAAREQAAGAASATQPMPDTQDTQAAPDAGP